MDKFQYRVQGSLKTGETIKNYKVMCELLKEKETTGHSKQLQLEVWKRYFDYEKLGSKFIIGEIYGTPFPSTDARKQKEGVYIKYIEVLLMEYLLRQKDYTASLTRKNLYEMLGLTNTAYSNRINSFDNIKLVMNNNYECSATVEDIQLFYQRADKKLNEILTSALKSMSQRFLINYSNEYIICTNDTTNDNGKNYRVAINEEIKLILEAQRETMVSLGCEKFYELILTRQIKSYWEKLNSYFFEKYNWDYVYSRIKIIYLADAIEQQLPIRAEELQQLSTESKILLLNGEVVKTLNTQAENKYKRNQKKNENQEGFGERKGHKDYQINFVEIQKQLAEYLIKINNSEKEYLEQMV